MDKIASTSVESGLPRVLKVDALFPEPVMPEPDPVHEFDELLFVVHGRYDVRTAGQRWEGVSGDAFYYPAGCRHEAQLQTGGSTMYYVVQWVPGVTVANTDNQPRRTHDTTGRMHLALGWIHELWTAGNADPYILSGLLAGVLHELNRDDWRDEPEPVARVLKYLHHNLHRELTLSRLAQIAGMSRYHFTRVFHDTVGKPPMKHLTGMRLEAAARLLKSTDLPLKMIGRRVGIPDPGHLSRLFKQHTGHRPTQIRSHSP